RGPAGGGPPAAPGLPFQPGDPLGQVRCRPAAPERAAPLSQPAGGEAAGACVVRLVPAADGRRPGGVRQAPPGIAGPWDPQSRPAAGRPLPAAEPLAALVCL